MSFQIKDFASITAAMINVMKSSQSQVTDFNVGSVARTLLEAPAAEMDELYQQMFNGLMDAIPTSVFQSFGFNALPAAAASGAVRFSLLAVLAYDLVIPAGVSVRSASKPYVYTSTSAFTIPAGSLYVDVMVYCSAVGVAGNTEANTLTILVSPVASIDAVTNVDAITNGRDPETDAERRVRFQSYVQSLQRGTAAALVYGAKTAQLTDSDGNILEYVASANVVEQYFTDPSAPAGYVDLYIYNGSGGTSTALVAETQKVINGYTDDSGNPVPGWKAAGVIVNVHAATELLINPSISLQTFPSYSHAAVQAQAELAVRHYLQNLEVGQFAILAEMIALIMDTEGVYNVAVSNPSTDISVFDSVKILPGVFTWS